MQVPVVSRRKSKGGVCKLSLRDLTVITGAYLVAGIFLTGIHLGYYGARKISLIEAQRLQGGLEEQQNKLQNLQSDTQNRVDALAIRLARLQAEMLRLNAIGQHIIEKAKLEASEFNFSEIPAQGGLESESQSQSHGVHSLMSEINKLAEEIQQRSLQLNVLSGVIETSELEKEIYPTGRPVKNGWLSSKYGWRTDPISGRRNYHYGIDFSGKRGSDVVAVASGIVTMAGNKGGYGKLVEITHGNGYITRYAHNDRLLVAVGNKIKQGQTIAHMGSTGHSTGPHVHFEVLKNGKKANPLKYISSSGV